jgi:ABC-type polysaccharide/polyol phosphate export permease
MVSELKELWRFRELLWTMVERDLKIRYKNSALGFLWSLLNPLLTVAVMTFVLENFFYPRDVGSLSAYILAAYLPFLFLQLAVMDSAQTVLTAMPLIKKIYFPRELLPIASVVANFIHLSLAMVVFFLFLIGVWLLRSPFDFAQFPIPPTAILLPFLLLVAFVLALGLAFYVSALNTFYEDVKYIVSIVMYLMFFLCPVMYFSEMVANSTINQGPGWIYRLYFLNPLASLIEAFRKTLVHAPQLIPTTAGNVPPNPLDWKYFAVATATSFAILISGYSTFNRMKWRFVERP